MDTSHDWIYSIILALFGALAEMKRILSIDLNQLLLFDGLNGYQAVRLFKE